jgi:hypothetical protein
MQCRHPISSCHMVYKKGEIVLKNKPDQKTKNKIMNLQFNTFLKGEIVSWCGTACDDGLGLDQRGGSWCGEQRRSRGGRAVSGKGD